MRYAVKLGLLSLCLAGGATRVEAVPVLQLDILGGHYDTATESIVSNGPTFTLVALLTPKPGTLVASLLDTYYVSAAIVPQTGPVDSSIGQYQWNGTTYTATQDMEYGTPPLEGLHDATRDPGDLSPHGVYPTFFNEFGFQFSSANRTSTYNSQDNPGGLNPTSSTTGVSYYQTFTVNVSSLPAPYALHFDLYDTFIQRCGKTKTCTADEDVDRFAPFSHDAQSGPGPEPVPEPSTLLLMAVGLVAGVRGVRARP